MKLLHKIVEALDRDYEPSESAKHRIGREVHVGQLSLRTPATFYFNSGMTVTSPVESWTESINGSLEIITKNTIYRLDKC